MQLRASSMRALTLAFFLFGIGLGAGTAIGIVAVRAVPSPTRTDQPAATDPETLDEPEPAASPDEEDDADDDDASDVLVRWQPRPSSLGSRACSSFDPSSRSPA